MKKYVGIIILVLLLGWVTYWIYSYDKERRWLNLEQQKEKFQIHPQADCEECQEESHEDLYLTPRNVVINFFGYLMAGEYENIPSFFDPSVTLEYFYAEKSREGYLKRVQEFGNAITRNNTLADIRIIGISDVKLHQYEVIVELLYGNETVRKTFLIEERMPEEGSEKQSIILTKPGELLNKEG